MPLTVNKPEELAHLHHWVNCSIMDAIQYRQVSDRDIFVFSF